jgi:hypothetical protein
MPELQSQLKDFWNKAVDQIKDKTNNISLWETLERLTPIIIEDNILILGIPSELASNVGHLTHADHKNIIEAILSSLAGKPLTFRIIEGHSLEDWHITKVRDARVKAMQSVAYTRRDESIDNTQSWDSILEYVTRSYSNLSFRQLPQVRARYVTDMLYAISDAMDTLYPESPDDQTERMLARVIEKTATLADIPSGVVAIELERLRAWNKQNQN